MEKKIILNITHLIELDKWFLHLTEDEKANLNIQHVHAGNYLGLILKSQVNTNQYTQTIENTEDQDFEFEIFDEQKWNEAKKTHSFLAEL